jgi:predicted phosphoribosyltransferase
MFIDREDAGRQLAWRLKGRALDDPLVLAIPRGGVVIGAVLAEELDADLDVVLSRKLRAPGNPEVAIGAVGEDGQVYLEPHAQTLFGSLDDYLVQERDHQMAEIARRQALFRDRYPAAPIRGRSVIVTDDGIATGSTMIAALRVARQHEPRELIVAVPVAPPERLKEVQRCCDDLICLLTPAEFWAVGQFYEDFRQVADDQVIEVLRCFAARCPFPARGGV